MAQVAIAFALRSSGVQQHMAVVGTRTARHFEDAVMATQIMLTEHEVAYLRSGAGGRTTANTAARAAARAAARTAAAVRAAARAVDSVLDAALDDMLDDALDGDLDNERGASRGEGNDGDDGGDALLDDLLDDLSEGDDGDGGDGGDGGGDMDTALLDDALDFSDDGSDSGSGSGSSRGEGGGGVAERETREPVKAVKAGKAGKAGTTGKAGATKAGNVGNVRDERDDDDDLDDLDLMPSLVDVLVDAEYREAMGSRFKPAERTRWRDVIEADVVKQQRECEMESETERGGQGQERGRVEVRQSSFQKRLLGKYDHSRAYLTGGDANQRQRATALKEEEEEEEEEEEGHWTQGGGEGTGGDEGQEEGMCGIALGRRLLSEVCRRVAGESTATGREGGEVDGGRGGRVLSAVARSPPLPRLYVTLLKRVAAGELARARWLLLALRIKQVENSVATLRLRQWSQQQLRLLPTG